MIMSYKLSPLEKRVFDLIPEDGEEVTSKFLIDEIYKDREEIPKYPRVVIMGTVNAITGQHIEGFMIKKSKRAGQKPIKIWKEKVL